MSCAAPATDVMGLDEIPCAAPATDVMGLEEMSCGSRTGLLTPSTFPAQLPSERLDELQLPPMVVNNEDPKQTAFTVSVDYKVHPAQYSLFPSDIAGSHRL